MKSLPIWVERLLRTICPGDLFEQIEGDLIEIYNHDVKTLGEQKAKLKFIVTALRFVRPGIVLRNRFSVTQNYTPMLKNHFHMAWRHIRKDKTYSSINVFGLSVSIAICFLIFQYSIYELRYDRFNEKADNIYRVVTHSYENNRKTFESALSSHLIGETLEENLREVVQSARLMSTRGWFTCALKHTRRDQSIVFNEHHLYYSEPAVFSIFSIPLKLGDKLTALEKPFSVVLSASAAKRYFGSEDAIGKILHLNGSFDENDYVVTGIFNDLPDDTHLDADIFLSLSSLEHNPYFKAFDAYTYVELIPETKKEALGDELYNFVSRYIPTLVDDKTKIHLDFQSVTDIHLYSSLQDEMKPGGNVKSIYFLLLVAFSVLLIAWINYINLATSRSISRAREVGIRKVSGASRFALVSQFLMESIIINILSVVVASLLVYFFSPVFYQITDLSVSYSRLVDIGLSSTGLVVVLIFCTGIFMSGFYPAKLIASHNPALVLKGKFQNKKAGLSLQKALVVFQFTCAIGLTVVILVFNNQFRFLQNQDLGIDIGQTIVVKAPTTIDSTYLTRLANFKLKLQASSTINSITSSSSIPGEKIDWTGTIRKSDDDREAKLNFIINIVDQDFISSYGLRLLAGRDFRLADRPAGQFGSKIASVILNKTATGQLGFQNVEDAIGTSIYWGPNKCEVVGVIDDFHQQSMKSNLEPILFTADYGPNLSFKLGKAVNSDNIASSISMIQNEWRAFFPDNPFEYFLLSDFYERQYANDKQVMNLFHFFCGLAILISGLGLFGLSSFTARQRTREMSIRKVLGAPTMNLVNLLTKEFLALVLVSSALAVPLSYIGAVQWLDGFAYHIDLNAWYFIVPVLLILFIAFLTIIFQTLRTISANPVETLKYE